MKPLQGNLTLDTSVIIEYLVGSRLGESIKDYFTNLKPDEKANCSLYAVSEVFYIICRLKGKDFAHGKITQMLLSNVIAIHNSIGLAMKTGELKCERAISLADCSTIAAATITDTRAVFVEEKELKSEIAKKPFEIEITFLGK